MQPRNTCKVSHVQASLKAAEAVAQEMMSKVSSLCDKMADMVTPAKTNEKVKLNPADQKLKDDIDSGEILAGSNLGKSFIREANPGTEMRKAYDALSIAD